MTQVSPQIFTLRMEYSATGEGVSIWTMVVVDPSEAGARDRFWTTCFGEQPQCPRLFRPGPGGHPGL